MATAETPRRSLKRTVASTVEGRSPRFLLGSLALAMVISLVAGLGIGMAIDNDTTSGTGGAATRQRATTPVVFATPPQKAVVVAVLGTRLAVTTGQVRRNMVIVPATRIRVTSAAPRTSIRPGAKVLFVLRGGGTTTPTTSGAPGATTKKTLVAGAILIVSGTAKNRIGSTVTAVTPTSMSFGTLGRRVTISTVGAKISKTIPSTRAKLLPGLHVLVKSEMRAAPKPPGAKQATRRSVVIEVVALPGGSAFG